MKKIFLFAMIVMGLLMGCTHTASKSYWVKDGEQVSSEQAQKEFQGCLGPQWIKDGMTLDEYEKDIGLCREADLARDKHIEATRNILLAAQFLTIGFAPVSVAIGVAGLAIPGNSDYFRRCMGKGGYTPAESQRPEELDQCMKDKGYEWRER